MHASRHGALREPTVLPSGGETAAKLALCNLGPNEVFILHGSERGQFVLGGAALATAPDIRSRIRTRGHAEQFHQCGSASSGSSALVAPAATPPPAAPVSVLAPANAKPKPLFFADVTSLNGNSREVDFPKTTSVFTGAFSFDANYIFRLRPPIERHAHWLDKLRSD